MTSPEQYLLSDAAAGRFEQDASCGLGRFNLTRTPGTETLAASVVALCRDREARIEIAARVAKAEASLVQEQRFAWQLSQDRIDLLAALLLKLESFCDLASPGCIAAERAACLLTDLRAQTIASGAADTYPDRPMSPRFDRINSGDHGGMD